MDVQSCLRFLFELYSSWLSNPSTNETPLNLLTETIRSMLMLSDLFSEVANFTWMQECFLEVQRVHPPEDDVMGPLLCLGLCKSIAITGMGRI